jgi:hypothetical protein
MREWPESWKQSLRYLAAARFYLPVTLKRSPDFGADEQYLEYLHHREFGLALGELAALGLENAGFAEESLFWRELELAANHMGCSEQAAEYRRRGEQHSADGKERV